MSLLRFAGTLCFAMACSTWALPVERPIDVQRSTIHIHVGKAGLFSAAGHEHWVTAPIERGSLDDGDKARIAFTVGAGKLRVEPDPSLRPEQQADVQRTMQDKVLESGKYPEISFRSTSVEKAGGDRWTVRGELTLHGQTRAVVSTVREEHGRYFGNCRIKQTDFGIRPVTVAGGTVKVKNEVEIEFTVVPAEALRK